MQPKSQSDSEYLSFLHNMFVTCLITEHQEEMMNKENVRILGQIMKFEDGKVMAVTSGCLIGK